MRQIIISMGVVASVLWTAPFALAQSEGQPPSVPETEEQTEQVLPPPSETEDGARAETTRTQHLDGLFALLADPNTKEWEPIAGQIWAAWNRSGSDSMDLLSQRADRARAWRRPTLGPVRGSADSRGTPRA